MFSYADGNTIPCRYLGHISAPTPMLVIAERSFDFVVILSDGQFRMVDKLSVRSIEQKQ